MKHIGRVILVLIANFIFWYLMFSFVSAELNVWKWHFTMRLIYVIISIWAAAKTFDD